MWCKLPVPPPRPSPPVDPYAHLDHLGTLLAAARKVREAAFTPQQQENADKLIISLVHLTIAEIEHLKTEPHNG